MRAVVCFYANRPAQRPNCQLTASSRVGDVPMCPSCLQQRSTLGKGQPVRPLHARAGAPLDPLQWVDDAAADVRTAEQALAAAVHRARQRGHSWAEIGDRLHVSRQAAQQRFKEPPMT